MKVTFFIQNDTSLKIPTQKIAFGAGLSAEFAQTITNADVVEISGRLAEKGVPTDFKGNKVIAKCSETTVNITQQLNKKYGLKLAMPKGIFVEDFTKLNIDTPMAHGFCNVTPTKLKKNSNEIIPSGIVYFNTFESARTQIPPELQWLYNWNKINQIADFDYETKHSSTDHFLYIFLHELTHVVHIDRLLSKYSGKKVVRKIELAKDKKQIEEYQRKYGRKVSQICDYAITDPLEAIACDIPKFIVGSLDKKTLMPTKNPFLNTPYENLSFWKRVNIPKYSDEDRPLQEILRKIWNGNFD